jgi:phage terminase large subunit
MTLDLQVTKVFSDIYDAYNKLVVNDSGELVKAYRLIVSYGSSRSSKTYSIMQLFALILLKRKNFKITVWRATRVDAIATVLEDFKAVLLSDSYLYSAFTYNKKDATFHCKRSNSIIHFAGTDVVSKVLGMRQDISFFNEISHFSKDVYLQIAQRTSETIFSDYNPSGETILDDYSEREDTIFLRSTFEDNPFLTEGIVNQLKGYNPYRVGSTYVTKEPPFKLMNKHNDEEVTDDNLPSPNEANIKNGTADKFMWLVYGLGIGCEKPNRIFRNWKECTLESFLDLEYTSYFGLDFGISSPTAMVEVKFDGDRTFYLRERLYKPAGEMGMPIYEWIRSRMTPEITDDDLIVCDSAKKSMVEDLQIGGLTAVGALKGQGSKQRMISQVQSFNILYTSDSSHLRDEYFEYSFRADKFGVVTDMIEDRNKDHLMDSIQYVVDYLVRYLDIVYN